MTFCFFSRHVSPPVSPSSPDQMPIIPMEAPSQRYEARIEEGKLYYDKRWYMHTIFFIWLIRSFKKKKKFKQQKWGILDFCLLF